MHCLYPEYLVLMSIPFIRPALQKPNKSHSKGRRALAGNALHVTVVTTTRTYGDFSQMNPPPYTPHPTRNERSFRPSREGAANGKRTRWPVAKWLFFLGFSEWRLPRTFHMTSESDFSHLRSLSSSLVVRFIPPVQWPTAAECRCPEREPKRYFKA